MTKTQSKKSTIFICLIAVLFAVIFKILPHYYFWLGQNNLKQQNYVKARVNLKKAYSFNKKNKDYRYYYVQALSNLSPTVTIQKEIFEIASGSANDSAQDLAENKVSEWRKNVILNFGDNYIEQAPFDKGIMRWDTNKFPLSVTIYDESSTALPAYYKDEIVRAFTQWQSTTKFIKFDINNTNSPNISVQIKPLPKDICNEKTCKYIVGFTTPKFKGNLLQEMIIVLYSKDPYGNFFSDKEIYNTALHEVGHALGIMGHSYSSEDLMYMASDTNNFYTPYRSSFQYLSSKDINTIKLLYHMTPTISNSEKIDTKGLIYAPIVLGTSKEISSRKLREAQNYIKNAPDLSGGYIDLGIAYADLKRNKDAIKAMQKALQLAKNNNEKYLCLYNMAAIYMNNSNFDNALKYAYDAQKISDTEEIKDLISNIRHAKLIKKAK